MRIEITAMPDYTITRVLESRLGGDHAVAFKTAMLKLAESGQKIFILDLSGVEFIDSMGLGAILSLLKRIGNKGEIRICGIKDNVAGMFKMTRMDRVFSIYDSVEQATAPVSGNDRAE